MAFDAPIDIHRETIRPEWIDYNGHMNVAYYVLVFDHATDVLFEMVGLGEDYAQRTNASTFALECHVNYLGEMAEGDLARVTTQLLDYDAKRLHYFHRMHHARKGYLAATAEFLSIHVDYNTRRSSPMPERTQEQLADLMSAHETLSRPEQAGRIIGIRR